MSRDAKLRHDLGDTFRAERDAAAGEAAGLKEMIASLPDKVNAVTAKAPRAAFKAKAEAARQEDFGTRCHPALLAWPPTIPLGQPPFSPGSRLPSRTRSRDPPSPASGTDEKVLCTR